MRRRDFLKNSAFVFGVATVLPSAILAKDDNKRRFKVIYDFAFEV